CSLEDSIKYILEYAKPDEVEQITLILKKSESNFRQWDSSSDLRIAEKRDSELKKFRENPKELTEKIISDIRDDLFAHVNNKYEGMESDDNDRLGHQVKLLAYGAYLTCRY